LDNSATTLRTVRLASGSHKPDSRRMGRRMGRRTGRNVSGGPRDAGLGA